MDNGNFMKLKISENHPIYNTFHIEAHAARYAEYASVEELQSLVPELQRQPVLHVGGGSNLLFLHDYDGLVLHCAIRGIDVVEEDDASVVVAVGAGIVWDDFVAYSIEQGWSGAENLSLIPGEVGASAVQNIGAYGAEAKDIIVKVEAVELATGQVREFDNTECHYDYRQSIFKQELRGKYAVTHVYYRLSKHFEPSVSYGNIQSMLPSGEPLTPQLVRDTVIQLRQSKLPDPDVQGNAGSFFMNPVVSQEQFESIQKDYPNMPFYVVPHGVKIPAGWLIEQCGWKGRALGKAAVHDRQALVLVNLGGATGQDILLLSDTVRQAVKDKFNLSIHPEVNIIS